MWQNGSQESKIGHAEWVGGMVYSLCSVNHNYTGQLWTSVSSYNKRCPGMIMAGSMCLHVSKLPGW